eukprot:7613838-Pyramimonas_sp.AAC.1
MVAASALAAFSFSRRRLAASLRLSMGGRLRTANSLEDLPDRPINLIVCEWCDGLRLAVMLQPRVFHRCYAR